jgi:hypothetical protein
MGSVVSLPLKVHSQCNWAEISSLAPTQVFEIVGETVKLGDQNYSFIGGHRVRLYKFKKNVHFRVPAGTDFNISSVVPAEPPRRQPPRR